MFALRGSPWCKNERLVEARRNFFAKLSVSSRREAYFCPWGRLGALLGPSWGLLGRLGNLLGGLWVFLGGCWGTPGATWVPLGGLVGRLGEILGRLGCLLGAQWGLWDDARELLGAP